MLKNWNNAVAHGCTNQETFNRIIADADDNTKMYFAGLNKGKGSIEGLKNSQKHATKSTIGLTIAQTALNIAISMGLMAAISLAIKGFDQMANYAKRASEAADKAFEETSGKVQEQQEELKTLDELISKYKELRKDGILDIDGRKEVKELQNEIADLVGTQARNLDLVNGKLDDEIRKLDEISAKEAKSAYETATANYTNAQRASSSATGDDSFLFFDGYAYAGSRDKEAEKILRESGFRDNVTPGGFFENTLFVQDSFDKNKNILNGAQEKADYLQSMIDVLEQNGQRTSKLYSGLIIQRDKYLGYINSQQDAANTLVSSWISYNQHSNNELSNITVNSVDSFETYRQKMIELAKNDESIGKILSDGTLSEKDLEIAVNDFMATSNKFSAWYKQWIGDVQGAGENTNEKMISLSEMEKTSEKISALSSAYKELSDNGYITTKTLGEIQTATGLSGDEWSEYESKLLRAKAGSAEFNQILSELTYKIVENEIGTIDLVNATEEEVAALEAKIAAALRENGVVNASAVAHDWLTREKEAMRIETELAKATTMEEVIALALEAGQAGITGDALNELVLQIGIFNNENLKVEEKIAALQELGYYANWAANEIAGITKVKMVTVDGRNFIQSFDKDGNLIALEEAKKIDVPQVNIPVVPDYSGAVKDSKKDDAENKALEALKSNLEARKQVIERYKEFVELTDFGLDLAEEDDFGLKSELLSGKISQLTSYGQAMREEFNRIANTIPKTGDQADALASRLQELGSNMRSNITEIRETQMELRKLSIDMASTLIEDRMEELNSQLDDIDRQINILNSDYKNDYSHVSNMLSMNMLLPSYSDFGGLRSKNSNANRELIRSEQETQDTINDIIETQIKKNEDLRESERQAILADMATMRNEVQIHLNDVNEDYVSSWRTSQNITDSGVMGIENAINNMDMKIPEPDISNVVKACELVKEMLDNMGNAEYTPPKIKVSDGIDGGDDSKDIINGNKANIVSNIAKNQLGVPYVWGGVAPGLGLDCSGLTQYAYRVAGVSLPRRSQEQWSCSTGTRIDWADLKKGDQLFFGSGNEATHTGIYVGNGQMIHAPSTGDVVKYSSINTEYYQGRFLGAKRYAVGTPKGNALAKDLGIAGENYKPEILIDKATGKATYIDKPTIIDPSKTDVVGEKATARMPKFADGTLSNSTLEYEYQKAIEWGLGSYLQDIKDGTIQSVFGNVDMDKRTIINWSDELKQTYRAALDSWEYDPDIGSVDTVFGGSGRFGEDINGTGWEVAFTPILPDGTFLNKNTVYGYINNILVEAYENDNHITEDELKSIDAQGRQIGETFVKGIFAGVDDSLNYDNNGNWAETVGRLMHFSGAFGAVELAKSSILNDISVESIEGFYNQVNDEIGKISAKYAKEYVDILHNPNLSDFDKSEKLYDIQYLMGQENSAIGEVIYNQLSDMFYQWLEDVENGTADWSLETYEAFTSTLDNIIEKSYDMVNTAVESKTAAADMRWENSNSWIEDRNYYKDWDLFTDSEINAWERVVKWLKKEFPKELDKIKEAERNLFEARKKEFEKINNLADSYLDSQNTLLQSYFEVTNSIAEARHEINKDLKASMTMYEYLDEKTRILLFNQEDYNKLSKELYDIEDKALKLKQNYEEDLDNATLDTIESITSEYQMQYKTLMKSYEIAKADLEIVKKKAQLNNVLNERNVRMFVNGQWMWVANTEDVVNAQNELADAVHAKNVAETDLEQQNSLNTITRSQNELNVVIKEFESGVIDLDEAVELAKGAIGELPRTLRYMFYKTITTSLPSDEIKTDGVAKFYKSEKGINIIGEGNSEAYVLSDGKIVPLSPYSISDMADNITFNPEMLKNFGSVLDIGNFNVGTTGEILKNLPQQNIQTYDNRIIINGMTVDTGSTAGKNLVDALQRYVSIN